MRSFHPFRIASLLLIAGLLVGCYQQPERMKNQPTNLKPPGTKVILPGKNKPFSAY